MCLVYTEYMKTADGKYWKKTLQTRSVIHTSNQKVITEKFKIKLQIIVKMYFQTKMNSDEGQGQYWKPKQKLYHQTIP